jgi:hypothetical protein
MKQFMGKSQFNSKLAVFHGHARITGPLLQELLEDGIRYAAHPNAGGDGNLRRLTLVLHSCQQVKTIPTNTIKKYIQQWVDAKWMKLDDGTMGFKFNNGAGSTVPDVTWWEWEGNDTAKAKPDIDALTGLKALMQRIESAQKQGKKVEHEELLPEIKKLVAKANGVYADEQKAATPQPVQD